jgi:uncharacterized membrane protein
MNRLLKSYGVVGRLFFGLALVGSGLLQLIRQDFVRHVPKLPPWVVQPGMWAGISGALLVVAGLAIMVDRKRRLAAIVVAALFFLVLLLYLPGLWANPGAGFMWTNPCKTLALLGTAILLVAMPQRWNPASGRVDEIGVGKTLSLSGGRVPPLSAALFGVFLVVCGVQHFVYVDFVVTLVPAWLPGLRFWAYFTGVALIAGGIGVNFPRTARLAATLSGVMIFLWVVLLHIPRAVAGWPEAFETAGIFEAIALSGAAFLLVDVGARRPSQVVQVMREPAQEI